EDGIRDRNVTGVQTCALPIFLFVAGLFVARRGIWAVGLFGGLVGIVARGFIQHIGCCIGDTAQCRCFLFDNISHASGGLVYPLLGFWVIPELLNRALSLTGGFFCLGPAFAISKEVANTYTDAEG